jgi:hypothetical protein
MEGGQNREAMEWKDREGLESKDSGKVGNLFEKRIFKAQNIPVFNF